MAPPWLTFQKKVIKKIQALEYYSYLVVETNLIYFFVGKQIWVRLIRVILNLRVSKKNSKENFLPVLYIYP